MLRAGSASGTVNCTSIAESARSSFRSAWALRRRLRCINSRGARASGGGMAALLLLSECCLGRNLLFVRIHIVDIESRVGGDESRACRSAGELVHMLARQHGVTAWTEGCAVA